jgi:ribosomal-protein-alanine N-acetyltransferase
METRKLNIGDSEAVAKIEKLCFSQPWSASAVADAIRAGDIFIGAFDNGLLGYIGLRSFDESGEIGNIAVHPDCRRKGIAKALLCALHSYARQNGIREIVLEVRASNEAAKALYASMGYTACGIRKNLYERPREDGVVMKTEL